MGHFGQEIILGIIGLLCYLIGVRQGFSAVSLPEFLLVDILKCQDRPGRSRHSFSKIDRTGDEAVLFFEPGPVLSGEAVQSIMDQLLKV